MNINANHTFWEDPGHGWLEVERSMLDYLGLSEKISGYSYQSNDGKTVYLEEDQDATLYWNKLKSKGIEIRTCKEHRDNIFIRELNSFTL